MDSLPPELLQQMRLSLRFTEIRYLCQVGALALFLYDALLTLDREFKYIWKARWSLSKVIYIFSRYQWIVYAYTDIAGGSILGLNNSIEFCNVMSHIDIAVGMLSIGVVQLTMALRISALYEHKTWAVWTLSSVFVTGWGSYIALTYLWWFSVTLIQNPLPGVLRGCLSLCTECEGLIRAWWVPLIVLDSVMFAMTLWSALRCLKEGMSMSLLMHVFYRDGMMYFAIIYALEIVQLALYASLPIGQNLSGIAVASFFGATLWKAICGVFCARLILNLQGALVKNSGVDIDSDFRTLTGVRFAPAAGTTGTSITTGADYLFSRDTETGLKPVWKTDKGTRGLEMSRIQSGL